VRIAPSSRSRVQVVGMDKEGRVQYLYQPAYVQAQQKKKFEKLLRFGQRLPALRQTTNDHIASGGLSRERVLAVMIRLINDLHFRLGTEKSVRSHRTYGLTTLRNRHLRVRDDGRVEFQFVGKHHIPWRRLLVDRDLSALLLEIKSLGGSHLFQYVGEEGKPCPITPAEVNRYIKTWMGAEFSAKDFRTWAGTLSAASALAELGAAEDDKTLQRNIRRAVCRVAEDLVNTPAICKSAYIHPVIFDCYRRGIVLSAFRRRAERILHLSQPHYETEEAALIAMLQKERREDRKE
jgi:DNA topoisomerase-1